MPTCREPGLTQPKFGRCVRGAGSCTPRHHINGHITDLPDPAKVPAPKATTSALDIGSCIPRTAAPVRRIREYPQPTIKRNKWAEMTSPYTQREKKVTPLGNPGKRAFDRLNNMPTLFQNLNVYAGVGDGGGVRKFESGRKPTSLCPNTGFNIGGEARGGRRHAFDHPAGNMRHEEMQQFGRPKALMDHTIQLRRAGIAAKHD